MRLAILATFVAAVAASPLGNNLQPRASACPGFKTTTTTVAGAAATLVGPFNMTANAPGLAQDGYYAHAGYPSIYTTVIFDISPLRRELNATTFWLEGGNLVCILDDVMYYVNDVSPTYDGNLDDSNVVISNDASIANKVACKIATSCEMNCTVGSYDYNCLADPTYQPDWRLTPSKANSGPGCVPFTPYAVPI